MPCAFAAIMLMLPPSEEENVWVQGMVAVVVQHFETINNPAAINPRSRPAWIDVIRTCLRAIREEAPHTPMGRFLRVGIAP